MTSDRHQASNRSTPIRGSFSTGGYWPSDHDRVQSSHAAWTAKHLGSRFYKLGASAFPGTADPRTNGVQNSSFCTHAHAFHLTRVWSLYSSPPEATLGTILTRVLCKLIPLPLLSVLEFRAIQCTARLGVPTVGIQLRILPCDQSKGQMIVVDLCSSYLVLAPSAHLLFRFTPPFGHGRSA